MNTRMIKTLSTVAALTFNFIALADHSEPALTVVGEPVVRGTGCPLDSSLVELNGEEALAKITFSSMQASLFGQKNLDRKFCGIVLQVAVPAGYQIKVPSVRLNGALDVGYAAMGHLRNEIFFAGTEGSDVLELPISGPINTLYDLELDSAASEVWSECGQEVALRMNLSVLLRSAGMRRYGSHGSSASIDTLLIAPTDAASPVEMRRCE
jgi:hypothetical protein